jgi:hypothetical protein
MDSMHAMLFHSAQNNSVSGDADLNHSKFVSSVTASGDDSKDDSTKEEIQSIGSYSFGVYSVYWNKYDSDYVSPTYSDLKKELLGNSFCALALFQYESIESRTKQIMQSRYGKSWQAIRGVPWMKWEGKQLVPPGQVMMERHLICVLTYTNITEMQYEFKRQGFRKIMDSDRERDVRTRNKEIAHWARSLNEAVWCFGTPLSRKRPLYHGISCKLIFNAFRTWFDMPTSLTVSRNIADTFAKGGAGIVLCIKHGGEADAWSLMLDVSAVSDYPNEKERLIFHCSAKFTDIWMGSTRYANWLKVLMAWERITLGKILTGTRWSTARQDKTACMMQNYLLFKTGETQVRYDTQFIHKNGTVPNYCQLMFNECCKRSRAHFPRYEKEEFDSANITNKVLVSFLDGSSDTFLTHFQMDDRTVYDWAITGDLYDQYFSSSNPWINSPTYTIKVGRNQTLTWDFHFELQNKPENGLMQCKLRCTRLPDKTQIPEMYLGILIVETKNETYSTGCITQRKKFAYVLYDFVASNRLLPENNPSIKGREFHVQFMISVQ